jgi:hypothetical protein
MQLQFTNLDANETVFFLRELEFVKGMLYNKLYPEFVWSTLFPVDSSAGPAAESITYRQYDMVGLMKFMSNYGDDAPRADVFAKEFTVAVKPIRGAYGYNYQEIQAAMMANRPLKTLKADAAFQAYNQTINDVAWFADGSNAFMGVYGFLYNPNVTKTNAPTGSWLTSATADQIIADVNYAITRPAVLTKKVERVNTVLMPVEHYAKIASTRVSTVSDTTILEFLQKVHSGVTFMDCNELAAVNPKPSGGAGPTDVLVAYRRDSSKLELYIPLPFMQFPPQERNLEYVVNTLARVAGIGYYYPLSCIFLEGI